MTWAKVIEQAISLLRQWGSALAAYFAGRAAGKEKAEDAAAQADRTAREEQDGKDRDFESLRRDDALRDELRRLREDREPDGV